jgi:hypothetical protein
MTTRTVTVNPLLFGVVESLADVNEPVYQRFCRGS